MCARVELSIKSRKYTPALVRKTRASLNASQALFAGFLGISPATLRAWERGANTAQRPGGTIPGRDPQRSTVLEEAICGGRACKTVRSRSALSEKVPSWALQRRPDFPGHEFFVADAVLFALGLLAAGDGEDLVEDLAADFVHGRRPGSRRR